MSCAFLDRHLGVINEARYEEHDAHHCPDVRDLSGRGVSWSPARPSSTVDSWQPKPGAHAVQADLRPSIGYYENAVTAINARHYALALEYLQAARAQKPDDVRVLTAFGVVYDKLGRFDLSARYYAQASAR